VIEKQRPSQAESDTPSTRSAGAGDGSSTNAPVLVDLGKRRRKDIKQLKRGEGPLVAELGEVIEQVRAELSGDMQGKTVLPVLVIYEKRPRRSSWGGLVS